MVSNHKHHPIALSNPWFFLGPAFIISFGCWIQVAIVWKGLRTFLELLRDVYGQVCQECDAGSFCSPATRLLFFITSHLHGTPVRDHACCHPACHPGCQTRESRDWGGCSFDVIFLKAVCLPACSHNPTRNQSPNDRHYLARNQSSHNLHNPNSPGNRVAATH